ncbi:hypothetical protein CEXT_646781 [Caerostris extrusa]|uniref:Uncharacterized protein n=1 Tax=Caerostris extrusa TaxID=172846 RepID=A0AAV4UHH2_CAEEX|nr:hypothetical protein CEXT_646781 [Caerostris extrusa]
MRNLIPLFPQEDPADEEDRQVVLRGDLHDQEVGRQVSSRWWGVRQLSRRPPQVAQVHNSNTKGGYISHSLSHPEKKRILTCSV